MAAIETEQFSLRFYTRGLAAWLEPGQEESSDWRWRRLDLESTEQHFPGAIQIVELYHARQHLRELSAKLFTGGDRWSRTEVPLPSSNRTCGFPA